MKLYILPSLLVVTALAFMSSSFVANDSVNVSDVKMAATLESDLIGSWSLSNSGRTKTFKKMDVLAKDLPGFTFSPEGKLIKRHTISMDSDKYNLKDFNGTWKLSGNTLTMTYSFDGGLDVREVVEIKSSGDSILEWKNMSSIELHSY